MSISDNLLQLMILFTLRSAGSPIPRISLTDILSSCDVSCMGVDANTAELVDKALILQLNDDGVDYVKITDNGKKVIDELKNDIPFSKREKIVAATTEEISGLCRSLSVKTETAKASDDSFSVSITLSDNGLELLKVSLFTPTELQAKTVSENFKKDPYTVYKNILRALISGTREKKNEG